MDTKISHKRCFYAPWIHHSIHHIHENVILEKKNIYILYNFGNIHNYGTYHSISSHLLPPLGYTQNLSSQWISLSDFSQVSFLAFREASKQTSVAGDTIIALLEQHPEWSGTKFTFEEPYHAILPNGKISNVFSPTLREVWNVKTAATFPWWFFGVRKLASFRGVGDFAWDGFVFQVLTELICWTRMMDPIGQDLETLHELIATKTVGLFLWKMRKLVLPVVFQTSEIETGHILSLFKQAYDQMLICNSHWLQERYPCFYLPR